MTTAEPDFFFAPRDMPVAQARSAVGEGRARRLGPGLYTHDLTTVDAEVVARHKWAILAAYFPDAVVTDRNAPIAQAVTDADGNAVIFVAHPQHDRTITLPGLRLVPRRGHGPAGDDVPFITPGVYLASTPRALVDNAAASRRVGGRPSRTLDDDELRSWVARLASQHGLEWTRRLRADVSRVAREIEREELGEVARSVIDDVVGDAWPALSDRPVSSSRSARGTTGPAGRGDRAPRG